MVCRPGEVKFSDLGTSLLSDLAYTMMTRPKSSYSW